MRWASERSKPPRAAPSFTERPISSSAEATIAFLTIVGALPHASSLIWAIEVAS